MADAPVQRFKDIKNAAGGTVNDVVLAVVAGALQKVLKARREATRGRERRPSQVELDVEVLVVHPHRPGHVPRHGHHLLAEPGHQVHAGRHHRGQVLGP